MPKGLFPKKGPAIYTPRPQNSKGYNDIHMNFDRKSMKPGRRYSVKHHVKAILTSLRSVPAEALIWAGGLFVLAVEAPSLSGHVTFCVPTLLGLDGCIGCGLGASIGHLFRGHLSASIDAHPLGIPATLLLTVRIVQLFRDHQRTQYHP